MSRKYHTMMSEDLLSFERIACNRRTNKVLAEDDQPVTDQRLLVERLLSCAGWAPFHRMCSNEHRTGGQSPFENDNAHRLAGVEPWRFYPIDSANCRRLRLITQEMEAAGKIPAMLASAVSTIVATWLPNPPQGQLLGEFEDSAADSPDSKNCMSDPEFFEPTLENVEHIAAASAAVQSLLLAATAAGLLNYWSTGGVLRSPKILNLLGIPSNQRVLGVIFLFSPETQELPSVQVVGSKLRESRGALHHWSRWVFLDSQ